MALAAATGSAVLQDEGAGFYIKDLFKIGFCPAFGKEIQNLNFQTTETAVDM